jgi:hypothetical protein
MEMKQNLKKLYEHQFQPSSKVLTIYLNTEPDRGKKPEWQIRLKNGLKKLKEYTEAEGNSSVAKDFNDLQKKVKNEIEDNRNELKRGLVLVACPSEDFWFMEMVQAPVPNAFYWTDQPQLEELDGLLDQYGSMGILMIGSEDVTVLDTFLGGVIDEWYFKWDIELEDWRQFQGLASGNREASGANHKEQYDKRYVENQQRWLRNLYPKLDQMAKKHKWKKVVLTGEENLTLDAKQELNINNLQVVTKNLNGRAPHHVMQEIYEQIDESNNKNRQVG